MSNDHGLTTVDDYLNAAADNWEKAKAVCPSRDTIADENDPGNAPHCGHSGNQSGMSWCELASCPRVQL